MPSVAAQACLRELTGLPQAHTASDGAKILLNATHKAQATGDGPFDITYFNIMDSDITNLI